MIEVRIVEFIALGVSSAVLGIVLGSGLKLMPPKREDRSTAEIRQMREWLKTQTGSQWPRDASIQGRLVNRVLNRVENRATRR
ncbi:MAG: hypothetical protein HY671_11100 [Chloroflexi bacterium]|nr:hypothetical protein [Chloroflexota bacterium]